MGHPVGIRIDDDHRERGGGRDGVHVGEGLGGLELGGQRLRLLDFDVEQVVARGGEGSEGGREGGRKRCDQLCRIPLASFELWC